MRRRELGIDPVAWTVSGLARVERSGRLLGHCGSTFRSRRVSGGFVGTGDYDADDLLGEILGSLRRHAVKSAEDAEEEEEEQEKEREEISDEASLNAFLDDFLGEDEEEDVEEEE